MKEPSLFSQNSELQSTVIPHYVLHNTQNQITQSKQNYQQNN